MFKLPMFLSKEEKEMLETELDIQMAIQAEARRLDREKRIKRLAKLKARPLHEKIADVIKSFQGVHITAKTGENKEEKK